MNALSSAASRAGNVFSLPRWRIGIDYFHARTSTTGSEKSFLPLQPDSRSVRLIHDRATRGGRGRRRSRPLDRGKKFSSQAMERRKEGRREVDGRSCLSRLFASSCSFFPVEETRARRRFALSRVLCPDARKSLELVAGRRSRTLATRVNCSRNHPPTCSSLYLRGQGTRRRLSKISARFLTSRDRDSFLNNFSLHFCVLPIIVFRSLLHGGLASYSESCLREDELSTGVAVEG